MQVGDLVIDSDLFAAWGIVTDIDDKILTVWWFYHEYFGEHQSYRHVEEILFINKNI